MAMTPDTATTASDTTTRASTAARPRGAARREALLDATLQLIGEVGADAVTHRRVAAAAGLPLASTTYWFQSKEHLLTAALQRAAELDLACLQDAAARLDDADTVTVADIVGVIEHTGERTGAARGSLLAVYSLLLEAARRPALQELSRHWTDAYLETVGRLFERAGSRRPVADARLLLAACDGLTVDELASGGHDPERTRTELIRLGTALTDDGGRS